MKRLFITGTDTEVGKTYVTVRLLHHYKQQGLAAIGLKPVAAGCTLSNGVWYNGDALQLQAASSVQLPYQQINPIALPQAIAPHLAAQQMGISLNVNDLIDACQPALSYSADVICIEGAGGWLVPLNEQQTLADFAKAIDVSVVLVVGMRLGCLNHALLTEQAIYTSGLTIDGWIANCIQADMPCLYQNITTLQHSLSSPCLGIMGYEQEVSKWIM